MNRTPWASVAFAGWLLRWEVLLQFRQMRVGRSAPALLWTTLALLLIFQAIGAMLCFAASRLPRPPVLDSFMATQYLLFALLMPLAMARYYLIELLMSGRNLSVYLSSPVSVATLGWVRLLAPIVSSWLWLVLLLGGVANFGALWISPGLLAIYPHTLACTAIAYSIFVLLWAALSRRLGFARARRTMQVLLTVLAVAIGTGYALANLQSAHRQEHARALPGETRGPRLRGQTPPFQPPPEPIRAFVAGAGGEPVALTLTLLAAAALVLAAARAMPTLMQQALESAAEAPARRQGSAVRFGGSLVTVFRRKEWRVLWRDPRARMQALMQPIIMVISTLPIFLRGETWSAAAAQIVMAASSLSFFFAQWVLMGEQAPQLVGAAPIPRDRLLLSKCLAIATPVLVLVALASLWVGLHRWQAGVAAAFCASASVLCNFAHNLVRPMPVQRASFMQSGAVQMPDVSDVLAMMILIWGWAAAAYFFAEGSAWAALGIAALITVPFVQWWRDNTRQDLLGY